MTGAYVDEADDVHSMAERTVNPVQTTVYFGVKMGSCRDAVGAEIP
jgi:hypothetical protein